LNPAKFKEFKILLIKQVSYNTKLFRFEIPHGKSLDLPIGRHISLKADIDGNKVIRAYTPTTRSNQQGYFDLLIKSYDLGEYYISYVIIFVALSICTFNWNFK